MSWIKEEDAATWLNELPSHITDVFKPMDGKFKRGYILSCVLNLLHNVKQVNGVDLAPDNSWQNLCERLYGDIK